MRLDEIRPGNVSKNYIIEVRIKNTTNKGKMFVVFKLRGCDCNFTLGNTRIWSRTLANGFTANLFLKILSIARPLLSMLNFKPGYEEKYAKDSGRENWLPWSVLIISGVPFRLIAYSRHSRHQRSSYWTATILRCSVKTTVAQQVIVTVIPFGHVLLVPGFVILLRVKSRRKLGILQWSRRFLFFQIILFAIMIGIALIVVFAFPYLIWLSS